MKNSEFWDKALAEIDASGLVLSKAQKIKMVKKLLKMRGADGKRFSSALLAGAK